MDISLFLGFPVDQACDQALQKMAQEQRLLFVGDEMSYLKVIAFEEKRYLGKSIEGLTKLADLRLLEEHIYSILQKMFPDHHCRNHALLLFTIPISPI